MEIGRLSIVCVAASLSVALSASVALAQPDTNMMLRNSAANQLGILQYCQSKGYIDGSAIDAQRTVIGRLPAGGSTDAAEKLGKDGTILGANESKVAFSTMVSSGNTTEAGLCTQMAGAVKQAAGANPATSMPAFPSTVPAMPNAMPVPSSAMPPMPGGMPSMPGGMPATPTAPSR